MKLDAPALALSPFLHTFGLPDTAEGTVQAQFPPRAAAIACMPSPPASTGNSGLAMVNGVVDGSVINQLFGTALRTVGLPAGLVAPQGPVAVRCAALRVDAANGIGTIRTLTMDSSRLLLQGGGSVDFGDQTLGVILRPQMRVAGTECQRSGRDRRQFSAPTTSVAPLSAVQTAASAAAGLSAGSGAAGIWHEFDPRKGGKPAGYQQRRRYRRCLPGGAEPRQVGAAGPRRTINDQGWTSRRQHAGIEQAENLLNTMLGK